MDKGYYWSLWAQALKSRGLNGPVAAFLEWLGPLNLFLVQGFYFGQPFFKGLMREGQWESLLDMLENQEQRHSFISLLLEEND